jgi:membrane protease YdiL (CAAX protease family)
MSNTPSPEAAIIEPEVLDIQHDTDPAQDHGPARRIPNLGHAILFFSIAIFFINLCLVVVFSALHIRLDLIEQHPAIALAAQALAYALTLLSAAWIFPRLWQRSFLHGIQWNILAVHRRWYWIVAGGILLCAAVSTLLLYIPQPTDTPIDLLMRTPRGAWAIAAFAVLLAPMVEEIAFRGFLLPALATAYDWLALERSPAGLKRWENSSLHSTPALIFAAIFSSVPFALLHAPQLSHAWGIVAVLYGVSLVLSFVRIRTHSVAASTLLHMTYNLSIFMVTFFASGGFRHLEGLPR